jgi:hypothetical protein
MDLAGSLSILIDLRSSPVRSRPGGPRHGKRACQRYLAGASPSLPLEGQS